jgi:N-dimethylarginine dimethylaminohydrolase
MSVVTAGPWSCNDWAPLEEVVLGSAQGLAIPALDVSLRTFFDPPDSATEEVIAPDTLCRVVEETEEDFAELAEILTAAGVTVRRPSPEAPSGSFAVPGWESTTMHRLMPRDCLLVTGHNVIEAPMTVRSRYFETFPFRDLLQEYFEAGANWLAAPKPRLGEETYLPRPGAPSISDEEPLFDGANILRCGVDLFYNVSNSGNVCGARWLQRVLGEDFTVHMMAICGDHVGTTLHILRPGLLLANSARLTREALPEPLRGWEVLWVEDSRDHGYAFGWPRASVWVGMNILALSEEVVVVPEDQPRLCRLLEGAGITPVPVRFRHARTLGGGVHCCSLDTRRSGPLESYL